MVSFITTGTDGGTFAETLILAKTYQLECNKRIFVCDFGMSKEQVDLLSRLANVVPKPASLSTLEHPWHHKASLDKYADSTDENFDTIIWIDSDMLPLSGFNKKLQDQISRQKALGKKISAARDSNDMSVTKFCNQHQKEGHNLNFFKNQLAERKIESNAPYINSGFFICTDKKILNDWNQLTQASTDNFLFEQNAFNLAVNKPEIFIELDNAIWNAHGELLADVKASKTSDKKLFVNGKRSYIVHATSYRMKHHEFRSIDWSIEGKPYSANVKLFKLPILQKLQLSAFLSVIEELDVNFLSIFKK